MYNLSEINTDERQGSSPYISYGSGQVLKINDIELKVSQNTGSPRAILHMETKPVDEKDFTPIDGHKGRVGKIACGVYMKTEEQKKEFLRKLKTIGLALGVSEDDINAVEGDSFETVVGEMTALLKGKWGRYTIFAEQYVKQDGKIGMKLLLPRYNFVESVNIDPADSKLIGFDPSNSIHFKKAQPVQGSEDLHEVTPDDLPF